VKKVGMVTLAPAPSMGSRADVSGNKSSGPAQEAGLEAAAAAGAGTAGSTAASAAALLLPPAAPAGVHSTIGALGCPAGFAPACCCWCQPRRAALSTAASEGSWYWQLHTSQGTRRQWQAGISSKMWQDKLMLCRTPSRNIERPPQRSGALVVGSPDPRQPGVAALQQELQGVAGAPAGGDGGGGRGRLRCCLCQVGRQVGQGGGCGQGRDGQARIWAGRQFSSTAERQQPPTGEACAGSMIPPPSHPSPASARMAVGRSTSRPRCACCASSTFIKPSREMRFHSSRSHTGLLLPALAPPLAPPPAASAAGGAAGAAASVAASTGGDSSPACCWGGSARASSSAAAPASVSML
jgi:hypothetical protein